MADQEFYHGSVGPLTYNDADVYDDDPAIHHCALRTPQQLYIGTAPIGDKQVVRLEDLVTALIGYIEKALLTEKGDIIYASAMATPAALAHGNAGDVLTSGGHGVDPSWQASSAVPGGADTQVQFNDGGSFGGDAYLIWDKTNHKLCISPDHSYDYGAMAHLENTDINSPDDYYGLVAIFKKTDGASDEDNYYIGIQAQMRISDLDKVHGYVWGLYVDAYLELGTIGTAGKNRNLLGIEINYGTVSGQTVNGNVFGLYIDGSVSGTTSGRKYDIWIENNPPKIGLINDTQTDADGSRYSLLDWLGRQSGGEISVLGRIGAFHDGTSDDQKGQLRFYTNDGSDSDTPTERVRIDSAGRMSLLGVLDKIELVLWNQTQEDGDGGRDSVIDFNGEQSGGEITTLARVMAQHDGTSDDEKGELIFFTNDGNDGNSPTERMRIDSAGGIILANVKSCSYTCR